MFYLYLLSLDDYVCKKLEQLNHNFNYTHASLNLEPGHIFGLIRTNLQFITVYMIIQVDVVGLVYWWGLTIDTVTSINTILAVGLAVDYAAHIGHTFMTVDGNRNGKQTYLRED